MAVIYVEGKFVLEITTELLLSGAEYPSMLERTIVTQETSFIMSMHPLN
jgi:hypothetical protein